MKSPPSNQAERDAIKLLESKGIEYLPEDSGDTTKILGSSKNFEMTEAGKMLLRQTAPVPVVKQPQQKAPAKQAQKRKLIVSTVPRSTAAGGNSTVTIVPASKAPMTVGGTRQPLVVQKQVLNQLTAASGTPGTTRVIRVAAKGTAGLAGAAGVGGVGSGPIVVRTIKSPVKGVTAANTAGSSPPKLIRIGNKLIQSECESVLSGNFIKIILPSGFVHSCLYILTRGSPSNLIRSTLTLFRRHVTTGHK